VDKVSTAFLFYFGLLYVVFVWLLF